MSYYEILVASSSYRGSEPLTYHSSDNITAGTIVIVPMRQSKAYGLVVGVIPKPSFVTKPIAEIISLPPVPKQFIQLQLWLAAYYPAPLGTVSQLFLPKSLLLKQQTFVKKPVLALPAKALPELSEEQVKTIKQIEKNNTYLLHGETGSGKTRVYIEMALKQFKNNNSSLILTPEIGLTPQLSRDFIEVFDEENVIITHSQLTESVRREIWLKVLQATKPLIVIGPRSALFSPIKNIGLIIIDEAHESSYKQEQLPHYSALKVAAKLAELHNAILILGSATPSVTDYFVAEQKNKPILRMKKIAKSSPLLSHPKITVVDLKDRLNFTRKTNISNQLIDSIQNALERNEQSLLFINRRGTARIILCERCGWEALCEHCDLPLTYHADDFMWRCHTCGFKMPALTSCPDCGNTDILLKSVGTKAVVDEITTLFPKARIKRFDTDNKKGDRLEQHYEAVHAGNIDILVGTQLITKGLDLPSLSVVGIINADTSLYFPDYSAEERTYQLLRQVIGRVGRGHSQNNKIIIQTYDPENAILKAAINNDWEGFYKNELQEREKFLFPPYSYLLKLTCRRASRTSSESTANKLIGLLRSEPLKISIDGPTPSFHEKIGSKYQWQIVIKSRDRKQLLEVIRLLPSGWSYDIDPVNIL